MRFLRGSFELILGTLYQHHPPVNHLCAFLSILVFWNVWEHKNTWVALISPAFLKHILYRRLSYIRVVGSIQSKGLESLKRPLHTSTNDDDDFTELVLLVERGGGGISYTPPLPSIPLLASMFEHGCICLLVLWCVFLLTSLCMEILPTSTGFHDVNCALTWSPSKISISCRKSMVPQKKVTWLFL